MPINLHIGISSPTIVRNKVVIGADTIIGLGNVGRLFCNGVACINPVRVYIYSRREVCDVKVLMISAGSFKRRPMGLIKSKSIAGRTIYSGLELLATHFA